MQRVYLVEQGFEFEANHVVYVSTTRSGAFRWLAEEISNKETAYLLDCYQVFSMETDCYGSRENILCIYKDYCNQDKITLSVDDIVWAFNAYTKEYDIKDYSRPCLIDVLILMSKFDIDFETACRWERQANDADFGEMIKDGVL